MFTFGHLSNNIKDELYHFNNMLFSLKPNIEKILQDINTDS